MLEQQIADKQKRKETEKSDEGRIRSFSKVSSPAKGDARHLNSSGEQPQTTSISIIDGEANKMQQVTQSKHKPALPSFAQASKNANLKDEINGINNVIYNERVTGSIEPRPIKTLKEEEFGKSINESIRPKQMQQPFKKADKPDEFKKDRTPIKAKLSPKKMVNEEMLVQDDPINVIINDDSNTEQNKINEWDEMKKQIDNLANENINLRDALHKIKEADMTTEKPPKPNRYSKISNSASIDKSYQQRKNQEEALYIKNKEVSLEEKIKQANERKRAYQEKRIEERKIKSNSHKKMVHKQIPQYDIGKNLDSMGQSKFVYPSPDGNFESELDALINSYKVPSNAIGFPQSQISTKLSTKQGRDKFHHFTKLPSIGHSTSKSPDVRGMK